MAKINWQNVLDNKKTQDNYYIDYSKETHNQYSYGDVINKWQNTLWPIKGKHYGKSMKDLPLHYLKWVGLNFDTNSKGYKLVLQELECRITNRT